MISFKKKIVTAQKTIKELEFGFQDMDGNSYYRFPPTTQFPLERHAKRADIIQWMSAGLTNQELKKLITMAAGELENLVAQKPGSLVKMGAILNQILMRETLVLHHDLMYQFIAVHYLREDEPLYTVVDSIMDEKIEQFKKMVAGGRLLDFFQLRELNNICNTIGLSKEEFQQAWTESEMEMKLMNQKIKYLTSEFKSPKKEKTRQPQS